MNKRGKRVICVSEIFLLVSVSFAISFLMGENFVGAQENSDSIYSSLKQGDDIWTYSSLKQGDDIWDVPHSTLPSAAPVPTDAASNSPHNYLINNPTTPAAPAPAAPDRATSPFPNAKKSSTDGAGAALGGLGLLPSQDAAALAKAAEEAAALNAAAEKAATTAATKVIANGGTEEAAAQAARGAAGEVLGSGVKEVDGVKDAAALAKTAVDAEAIGNAAASKAKWGGTKFFGMESAAASGPWGFFGIHLAEGIVWGGVVALAIKFIGPMLGLEDKQADALAMGALGGIVAGKTVYGAFGALEWTDVGSVANYGWSIGIGAVVAFAIIYAMWEDETQKIVKFECLPFEPPIGGKKCEECNADPFRPCSEYRCRSLGQACQIVNAGTAEERCVWVNPKDVNSPIITTWLAALKPTGLTYTPDNAIRPPNRGVKIINSGKTECIAPFTPLEFGISLNEPAQCKIDYNMTRDYDSMSFYMGGSNYLRYNHTEKMKLPGPDVGQASDASPVLKNDGTYSLYVRCRDANGNYNVDAFVFNFCVDPSPDTTPPMVMGTSILDNGFVRYKAEQTPIELYINEPSECKWSRESRDYDNMENTMKCDTAPYQMNADLNYVCRSNLTGLKDSSENKYFFRCKDQPTKQDKDRNVMTQSYPLTLMGTQPLTIIKVGPNETVSNNTDVVTVELYVRTDDGAEEGKALCYISKTGASDSFIMMAQTNNYESRQSIYLPSGYYTYFFKCIDAGGNVAQSNTTFIVYSDNFSPLITRVYKDEINGLKIVTDEDAQCVYDISSCNYEFKDGIKMHYVNPELMNEHYTDWKESQTYYIKCSDMKGNEPENPNECSIVVNSVNLESG